MKCVSSLLYIFSFPSHSLLFASSCLPFKIEAMYLQLQAFKWKPNLSGSHLEDFVSNCEINFFYFC